MEHVEFPAREDVVLSDLLARRAEQTPDAVFAVFEDGAEWTFAQAAQHAWGAAAWLLDAAGVQRGEIVASWLPNGPEALLSWFGANAAGCVYAPLNTAYRGAILQNALNLTEARVLVAHAGLVERLEGLDLPHLEIVITVGAPEAVAGSGYQLLAFDDLAASVAVEPPALPQPVEPWDDMAVMLTSGTTGVSKAVRRTYVQYGLYASTAFEHVGITGDDRFYVVGPLFHGSADVPVYAMLRVGGSVAIVERFSASQFWHDVRRFQASVTWMFSAISLFLAKQPPASDDRDNPLRLAMFAPMFPGFDAFAARHDFRVYTVYGMTEVPCPFALLDPANPRSVGRPADPLYEVRLVDEHDVEVPDGAPGEMILRHRLPWAITPGYLNNAAATAAAWRNGWFHTGDVFVRDTAGEYSLVDRVKDSIRRRGENVSAAEVETELLTHDDVIEAAVLGVPAEIEEDILAYVALRPGATVAPVDLIEYLTPRLPYFALPRYIHTVPSLPRSVALRVDKPALRAGGLPPGAWDRETAGVVVENERFGRTSAGR